MPAANGVADHAKGPQKNCFPLSLDNINPRVKEAQYAVRCVCWLPTIRKKHLQHSSSIRCTGIHCIAQVEVAQRAALPVQG